MVYTVRKTPKGWELISPFGTRIDTKATRKAAVNVARLLAGWRGSVTVEA